MRFSILDRNLGLLLSLISASFLLIGLLIFIPLFSVTDSRVVVIRDYTSLELLGRSIYLREGCQNCHSQFVRSLPSDIDRYGGISLLSESRRDFPTQWGLRRIGGDLSRVGGRYSDDWLVSYLSVPFSFDGSVRGSFSMMPSYAYLGGVYLSEGVSELDALVAYLQSVGLSE